MARLKMPLIMMRCLGDCAGAVANDGEDFYLFNFGYIGTALGWVLGCTAGCRGGINLGTASGAVPGGGPICWFSWV